MATNQALNVAQARQFLLAALSPVMVESGVVVEGSLMSIANAAATIAQAKLTLADLDDGSVL